MRAVLISAVLLGTAATFYGTAHLTSSTIQKTETAAIAERAKFTEVKTSLTQQIAELKENTARDTDALTADFQAKLKDQTAQIAQQASDLSDTLGKVATLEQTLEGKRSELETVTAQISDLKEQVDAANKLAAAAADKQDTASVEADELALDAATQQMAVLSEQIDTLNADVAALETELKDANARANASETEMAALTATLAERDTMIAQLKEVEPTPSEEQNDTQGVIAALESERDDAVAALEAEKAKVAEVLDDQDAASAEVQELTATLQELDAKLTERDTAIVDLGAMILEKDALIEVKDAVIAGLQVEEEGGQEASPEVAGAASSETTDAAIAELDEKILQLTALTTEQATVIETLRLGLGDASMGSDELAEVCITRAAGILESSQIRFGVGTSSIDAQSEETMDRLRDLAIGCQNESLIVEIGGHTDSQGTEATNQALSEARAQAVMDFLADNGVPSESMRAVGFGEADPIATNDTRAGRTANRRITFVWKPLETEPAIPNG